MVRTIAVGGLALLLIVGTTVAVFGAGWAAVSVVAAIMVRVTLVAVPLGALAQALVRHRPLPFWTAGLIGLSALLAQSLVLHRPALPLDPVAGVVWLSAVALSAALVEAGAALFRAAQGSSRGGEDSVGGIEA